MNLGGGDQIYNQAHVFSEDISLSIMLFVSKKLMSHDILLKTDVLERLVHQMFGTHFQVTHP